jgi:uncharacterized protein YdhG (YjbR/CyaY superfamily)
MNARAAYKDVDAYLADVKPEFRPALNHLRALIRELAPDALEVISYGVPCYKLDGPLVSFGAAAKHCAFYGMSPKVLAAFAGELTDFSTSPGTVRFTPEHPMPDQVLRAIITTRIAENAAAKAAKKKK